MANKFLNVGRGGVNLENGSARIYANSLSAKDLNPSFPLKTNSLNKLVSERLDISDVNNLQSALDSVITNPLTVQLTTNQTTFTQDQELITKKYVDDNAGGGIEKPNNCLVAGVDAGDSLTTGDNNILLGAAAGQNITTGRHNFAIGDSALNAITTQTGNIAIGQLSQMDSNGVENVTVGHSALRGNTTGSENICIGTMSGFLNSTGRSNTYVGFNSGLKNTTHPNNVAIGHSALENPVQAFNTAVGSGSQKGISGSNGFGNTSIGYNSLFSITSGNSNTNIGTDCGGSITTGNDNVFIGSSGGGSNILSGSGNTAIGRSSNFTGDYSNSTVVGRQAECDAGNQVCLGDSNVTQIINSGDSVCDLGSNTHKFKDIYISGELKSGTPSPTSSTIISSIDYSSMYPSSMLANITASGGGTNKCWGHTAKYIAGADLLAGRVVSLKDQTAGSDNSKYLEVDYLIDSSETNPTVVPIGVTQSNALAGETVDVCIQGYTTAIAYNADSSPERGSQIMSAPTASQGKVYLNTTGGGNECRFGFMAQSDSVSANDPVLIYFRAYYQPY